MCQKFMPFNFKLKYLKIKNHFKNVSEMIIYDVNFLDCLLKNKTNIATIKIEPPYIR